MLVHPFSHSLRPYECTSFWFMFRMFSMQATVFCGSNYSIFGPSSRVSCVHTDVAPSLRIFLGTSLFPGRLQLLLHTCFPSPRISHFSVEPCFLPLENGIRNPDLVTQSASTITVPVRFPQPLLGGLTNSSSFHSFQDFL